MNALSDAEKAVAEAREPLLARLGMAVGNYDRARDEGLVDKLIAAVRHHDAETVRTEGHQWSGEAGRAILQTADRIDPDATPTHTGPGRPASELPAWAVDQLADRGIDPGEVSHFIAGSDGRTIAAAVDGEPVHLTRP